MAIEIEKKYRLNSEQRSAIERRLRLIAAKKGELELEENTLYRGGKLDFGACALRLRRVNQKSILTFKQRVPNSSTVKQHLEEETEVASAERLDAILRALGFRPGLVYEKRRTRWRKGSAEIALDELPFGLFMEIEAPEKVIARIEKMIGAETLPAITETYPALTIKLGKEHNGVIEARFRKTKKQ